VYNTYDINKKFHILFSFPKPCAFTSYPFALGVMGIKYF